MDDSARAGGEWPTKLLTAENFGQDGRLAGAWAKLAIVDAVPAERRAELDRASGRCAWADLPKGWRQALVVPLPDYRKRLGAAKSADAKADAIAGVGGANRGAIPANALAGQASYTVADLQWDLAHGHVALEMVGTDQQKHAAMQSVVDHFKAYAPAPGLPFQLTKIGHVVLQVKDLDRAVAFYTQILGFKVSDVYPPSMVPGGMVFLRCSADHHGVGLVGGGAAESQHIELNHMAFEVASLDEVIRARAHLGANNVPIDFEGRRRAGCQIAVEFRDPDGHRLEIFWGLDLIGSGGHVRPPEEWRQFFTLEDSIANPPPGQDTTVHEKSLLKTK